jgi:pyrroloquinoline-quinone synthase
MTLERKRFAEELMAEVRRKRSFGGHPLWFKAQEGRLSRPQLQGFATQFYLQVYEFPRAVSALHSRCLDFGERRKLAESLYEEETGTLSGTKPHPELFLDFCEGVGLARDAVRVAEPLPSTAALTQWFEYSTKVLSFLEGVAAINFVAEGQVVGAFAPLARGLQRHYGLSKEAVAFWDVHEMADAEHSAVGDHIVVRNASSEEVRERVRSAVRTSLAMWWQLFDGIDRAYAAP